MGTLNCASAPPQYLNLSGELFIFPELLFLEGTFFPSIEGNRELASGLLPALECFSYCNFCKHEVVYEEQRKQSRRRYRRLA